MSTFIDFAELKEFVSIEQVIGLLQLNLKHSGKQLRGCCPIHQGTDKKEFVVTPEKGLFYCFKCKEGGDMIKLYARVNDLDQKDAAKAIQESFGTVNTVDSTTVNSSTVQDQSTVKKFPSNVEPFQPLTYLLSEHEALETLGIDAYVIEHFGAGYAPKGILRGRFALPMHDLDGNLLGYCGHTLKNQEPKLSFPKDFDPASVIFNAHRCEPNSLIDLRSDPLDVLLAYQGGLVTNVISFLTEEVSGRQLQLLSDLLVDLESHI